MPMCALTRGGTNLMAISALEEIRLKEFQQLRGIHFIHVPQSWELSLLWTHLWQGIVCSLPGSCFVLQATEFCRGCDSAVDK
jgi:hypothetical protein